MSDIAVVFASGFTGNTKNKAEYIAKSLGADLFNLKENANPDLSSYSKIVVGTGVHAGKPYAPVVSFCSDKKNLEGKKTFLFILCIYSGERGQKQCSAVSEKLGISNAVFFNKKATTEVNKLIADIKG